jgi:MATE family multidrug resistance protein
MGVTDLAVVGHLGSEYLAAASLSLVWQTVTSAFVLRGFAVAVNTLGGQALGAGHPKLAGMWLQVALVGVSIVMAPIALSWWFTEDVRCASRQPRRRLADGRAQVLLAAGLGARVSHLAGVFSRWSAFYALPSAWFPVAQAFFRCQGVVAPALVVNAVFLFVNALLNLVLVRGLFIGCTLAAAAVSRGRRRRRLPADRAPLARRQRARAGL